MNAHLSGRGARFALAATFLAAPALSQTLLYTRTGDKNYDHLATCVRGAGDVNGDGLPDLIVGAPEDGFALAPGEGFARVYNGATGATIWTFNGASNMDLFGSSVDGLGDVNGDGRSDLVVGAPQFSGVGANRGRVYVYSGLNGTLLWSADGPNNNDKLGMVVAGAGDVNGDGVPDVIAASRDATAGGTQRGLVRVLSGVNGNVLFTLQGTANSQRLGLDVDGVGDVNGDGRADFLVSSFTAGVKLYSGLDGSVLRTFTAATLDDVFGASVAGIGDVTGDGVRDLAIGATQDGNIFTLGAGYVKVFDGASGALVRTFNGGATGDRFGVSVADACDLNGDGRVELLVGADQFGSALKGYARLLDVAAGTAIHTFQGLNDGDRFGASVAGLGNVDGAGGPEVAIGAPDNNTPFLVGGRCEVWTPPAGGCPTPYTFCTATSNTTGNPALISWTGTTSVSTNNFALVCNGLPPNTNGLFYFGPNEILQSFGNGFRCVGGTVVRLNVLQVSGAGVAVRPLDFNNMPAGGAILPGATWKFQFWYRNPAAGGAGYNLSNGLSATFCN
jgi:hypothetical protein